MTSSISTNHGCLYAELVELGHTKPRGDTSQYHRYLAGFVLCQAKPLVVAVTDVPKSDAVERLFDYIAALPFEIAGLLTDRRFYDGTSIERLVPLHLVALPIVCGGERMAENLNTTVFYWTEYVIYEGSERELEWSALCLSFQRA
ncbi:hypothetical protein [Halostagnicola sp. A-GB9-2]|uniref:hypothetical protein n=1 Tax=Halostagnicola sp. A-GB9-2 TaxID=3048066 RepID=UPI0024C02171|nr:hypothetical protein [Halostagnicola sp. A-GB9-2]MDJ1433817.1 hypothetical protein [Halostagnicola sp. A-GB9-2]